MTVVRHIYTVVFAFAVLCAPQWVQAAVLSVQASDAQVSVGSSVVVWVAVDSEGIAINNAEGTLGFPSDLFEVVSVNQTPSIFTLWIQSPAFAGGDISFNGGLPSPGYTGQNGRIFSVTLRAKAPGSGMFTLGGGAVRANDGLGTDVLRASQGASVVVAQPATPSVPAATPTAKTQLSVSSPTHSSQDAWYNNASALMQWTLPTGVDSVQTLLSKDKGTTPTVIYKPAITKKQLDPLEDGVWYFNIRARTAQGWGEVVAYKLQIDTVAPKLTGVEIAYANGTLRVAGSASDERSGIAGAELWIDGVHANDLDTEQLEDGVVQLVPLESGEHTAQLRVVDRAGNAATSEEVVFTVEASPHSMKGLMDAVQSIDWNALVPWALPISVVSLLFNVWLWVQLKRQERRIAAKPGRRGGDKFQKLARQRLTGVKKDLQKQLRDLERADKRPDITPADAVRIKKVRTQLQETQKYIEQKIEDVEKP